jgi:hypothetical protein
VTQILLPISDWNFFQKEVIAEVIACEKGKDLG